MSHYNKIMIPLDGSDLAELALEPAIEIARCIGASLVLFRVARPIPRTRALEEMPDVYNDVVAATYRNTEEYLKEVAARWPDADIAIEFKPASDPVPDQIIDFASSNDIDLIIMSTHGRTGVSRWAYGSVTDKVLRRAHCDTLVIRGSDEE